MAEQKLPKLTTRVRFPSPAPPAAERSATPWFRAVEGNGRDRTV